MTPRALPAAALAVLLAVGLALGACGKRGNLEPPDGRKPDYPRTYPSR
ncbi:MAG: hypothetical protein ACK4QW_17630 [Alphaproteobacteria bacterium]